MSGARRPGTRSPSRSGSCSSCAAGRRVRPPPAELANGRAAGPLRRVAPSRVTTSSTPGKRRVERDQSGERRALATSLRARARVDFGFGPQRDREPVQRRGRGDRRLHRSANQSDRGHDRSLRRGRRRRLFPGHRADRERDAAGTAQPPATATRRCCTSSSRRTRSSVSSDGEFVSLLDPPGASAHLAAGCRNIGTWPVLVGCRGRGGHVLSSPIILYDYPEIAAESPGDLFDSTEIDEILTLRIMTLTDDEKRSMAALDDRGPRAARADRGTGATAHGAARHIPRDLRPLREAASWIELGPDRRTARARVHPRRRSRVPASATASGSGHSATPTSWTWP